MGFFDPPKCPVDIKLLNVENGGSKAMINYRATYADKSSKNIRIFVDKYGEGTASFVAESIEIYVEKE